MPGAAATAAVMAAAIFCPAIAHAGAISGGGCRTQSVGGVTVQACISHRDSSRELVGSGAPRQTC